MISEAIDRIIELAKPEIIEAHCRTYSTKKLYPVDEPIAETVRVGTLSGLIEFLKHEEDEVRDSVRMIHVIDHAHVAALSSLIEPFAQRARLVAAVHESAAVKFDRYMTVEEMVVWLATSFVANEDRAYILQIIGNLRDEKVQTLTDNGMSQQVTARAGIARVESTAVRPIVTMAPRSTFAEVEQPESNFIFRLRPGSKPGELPTCALFASDDQEWKLRAMGSVKRRLEELITEAGLDIPVIA